MDPLETNRPASCALTVNSYVGFDSKSKTAIRTDNCPVEASMSNASLSSTSDHVRVHPSKTRVISMVYVMTDPSSTSLAATGTGTRSPRSEFSSM